MKATNTKVTLEERCETNKSSGYIQREQIYTEGNVREMLEQNNTCIINSKVRNTYTLKNTVSSVALSKPINIKSCVAVRERARVY